MTREEIESMPAGYELDQMVAAAIGCYYSKAWKKYVHPTDEALYRRQDEEPSFNWGLPRPTPAYSTDIAAAWQVLDSLRPKGFIAIMENVLNLSPGQQYGWRCELWPRVGVDGMAEAVAETAPLSVCRAALLTTL